jgi:TonB family protein
MTNSCSRRIERYFIAAAMLCVFAGIAYGDDTSSLAERLHRAATGSSLDDASLKPWHLKLGFQLFDSKGKAAENGTIEEWWYSPEVHKTVYTSPSYTSTEIRTKDGFFRSKGVPSAPYLLRLMLKQAVHPMPDEKDISAAKPDIRKETISKVPLDCIMLSQEIKNNHTNSIPLGLFPTYCFDHSSDTLRMAYDFGSQTIVLNSLGTFQQHNVAIDQTMSWKGVPAINGHIDVLQGILVKGADFAPSTDLEKIDLSAVKVDSNVIYGNIISQARPTYPERARANHVSGSVVLGAIIARDGQVRSLKLLSVPDADLAIAAVTAVREWRYKPYLLNGEPTEVETTLTVNFNIAP